MTVEQIKEQLPVGEKIVLEKITITHSKSGIKKSFDLKTFKEQMPEVYEQFVLESEKKAVITVRIRKTESEDDFDDLI